MKTRMTFRIADDLATELRKLPNQTEFVEALLRDALGATCPLCQGSGRVPTSANGVRLPNWRAANLPRLDRETALQLKALVRLAKELAATNIALEALTEDEEDVLQFALERDATPLLRGRLIDGRTEFTTH